MAEAFVNVQDKKIATPMNQTIHGGDPSVPNLLFDREYWHSSMDGMILEDYTWEEWEAIAASW